MSTSQRAVMLCGWEGNRGLTACTPGSAPGPTLGNEYGKPLPCLFRTIMLIKNEMMPHLCLKKITGNGNQRNEHFLNSQYQNLAWKYIKMSANARRPGLWT